jgi:hypothetical protein
VQIRFSEKGKSHIVLDMGIMTGAGQVVPLQPEIPVQTKHSKEEQCRDTEINLQRVKSYVIFIAYLPIDVTE